MLAAELDRVHARMAGRFARSEPRRRARQYLSGLVTGAERQSGWSQARWAGDRSPDGMQRLLRSADWDVDGARDDVRDYVLDRLRAPRPALIAAVLAFPKRGVRSAGVARQPGNCQLGVFLVYRSGRGEALIDRRLYLPRSWTDDPVRCRAAGIPEQIAYASTAHLAEQMLAGALQAGARPARVSLEETAECLRRAEDQAGLGRYQVRDWRAWHAHITLSMAAFAAIVSSTRRSS